MARIVGIDLGTTNSLIAYMDDKTPMVIPGRTGRTMVPSVVAMTDNGLIVGDPAKEHLVRDSARTIYSIKRFMGKGLSDVQEELAYFPYKLHEQGGVIRDSDRREELFPSADIRHDLEGTETAGRGLFGRGHSESRHHRAGLLQRQPDGRPPRMRA